VLVAAFEGWNDAGDASTTAVRWLTDRFDARAFATIDPEEFFDFTSTRPRVEMIDGTSRRIIWPETQLAAAAMSGTAHDLILLVGTEPQLRWPTFCRQVVEIASALDVEMVITLGALLAEVPHSRPTSVIGTAYDPSVVEALGLRRSTYEGPTGIVGVLHDAFQQAGIPSASLWAAVPTYVPGAPSPKAALALVERTATLVGVPVITTDLEIASAAYERQISELVAGDDDTAAYVARLEIEADTDDDPDTEVAAVDRLGDLSEDDAGELVEELEQYLRDHRRD
jgi:proteasome assembly chaperone (PAC2) family protein